MSTSTMVRISSESKGVLSGLARHHKISQQKMLDKIIQNTQRTAFFDQVDQAYKNLKKDSKKWEEVLAERQLSENTLLDNFVASE